MGSLSWSHTLSVRHGTTVTDRCCSFHTAPWRQGARFSVHKGRRPGAPGAQKVVVKVCRDGGSEEVEAEMKKWDVLEKAVQRCSAPTAGRIRLVRAFQSSVDKVGRLGRTRKAGGRRRRLSEGDSVLVQDRVEGEVQELFDLASPAPHPSPCPCLRELARRVHALSQGRCALGAAKGVACPDPDRGGVTRYHLTSLTLHSRSREFGAKDQGVGGLETCQRRAGLAPPPLPASAPPLDASSRLGGKGSPASLRTRGVFAWTTSPAGWPASGEDLSPRSEPSPRSGTCRGRPSKACSLAQLLQETLDFGDGGWDSPARVQTLANLMAAYPELRSCYPEWLVTSVLGPVPAYSC